MQRNNYVDEIKRIPIQDVVSRLGLKLTRTGTSLQGQCPTGHSSKNGCCFSVNTLENYFNCFHCNEAGDNITLVELVKDVEFKEAVTWLANEFNIIIPDNIKSESHDVDPEFYQRAELNNAIFEYGKYLLYETDGGEARNYLITMRGYNIDTLKQTEWIVFTTEDIIKNHLRIKYPDAEAQINKLHLDSFKEITYWAAFPYRNRDGIITGFLKRALKPQGYNLTNHRGEIVNNLRWHSTMGTNKHDLFNLHRCKNQNTLLIVEGYPDAMLLPVLGLDNIVAVGQGKLAKSHLEGLDEFGIRNVIIAFDNDNAGLENTTAAIKLLLTSSRINTFVIDPTMLAPYKDPDEYVLARGIDAFFKILDNAESGAIWLAKVIVKNNDITLDIEKQKALDDASELINDIVSRLAADQFASAIAAKLKLNIDTVKQYFHDYEERTMRAKLSEDYKKLIASADALRRKGDLEGASKLIETQGLELKNELYKTKIRTTMALADYLLEKYQVESHRTAQLLGYNLKKFPSLVEHIDGVQPGLYIIGAETNAGKTAMLTSISMDLLQTNDNVRAIYFSLDDNKNVIINRFLGIISKLELNKVQRMQTIPDDVRKLKDAYDQLISYANADRLYIKDLSEVNNASQAEALIQELYSNDLVVLLDGLYNLDMEGHPSLNIRQINIDRASLLKGLSDRYHIPLLSTAELRKKTKEEGKDKKPTLHDIMETGKFGYNANVVWLLAPMDSYDASTLNAYEVQLNYAKNKLSHYKGNQTLIFEKIKGIMSEPMPNLIRPAMSW